MRKGLLSGFVCAWVALAGAASAQISSFPAPPPLQPPAAPAPAPATSQPDTSPPAALPPSTMMPDSSTNAAPAGSKDTSGIPNSAATLSSMSALDDHLTLHPGDRISFRVIEDQDDAVPRFVTDTGEVDFPYIGRVKVEGKTCLEVAKEVKQLLEVDYYKRATVIIGLDVIFGKDQSVTHNYAWVVGQVRSPGPQELLDKNPMTVSQTILRAGGFGDFADQRRVRLIHRADLPVNAPVPSDNADNTKAGQVIDVKAVFDGQSSVDPVVKNDDYIVVPKRLVNF